MQAEAAQPFPDVAEVSLRIPSVLESDHDIIRIADDDRFAFRDVRAPFPVEPQIRRVVQEHVCQQRLWEPYDYGNLNCFGYCFPAPRAGIRFP